MPMRTGSIPPGEALQELSEHTAPFDALVLVLEGTLTLTIGAAQVHATQERSSGCRPISHMPSKLQRPLECYSSCFGTP